jgi:hypothetical protein
MDRQCVAREIGEDGGIWCCTNVSGLWVEHIWLLAHVRDFFELIEVWCSMGID